MQTTYLTTKHIGSSKDAYQLVLLSMPRPITHAHERGDARTRHLDAARNFIRSKGFAATTLDDICGATAVTKVAFFHNFESKNALGVATAEYRGETTGVLFEGALYHDTDDPLDRLLAYVAFRREIISDDIPAFTCPVGALAQEVRASSPDISDAAAASIFDHSEASETDIQAAIGTRGIAPHGWNAASLARHFQAVLQGGFVRAKAGNNPDLAREAVYCLDLCAPAFRRVPIKGGLRPCNPIPTSSFKAIASKQ